VDRANSSKIGKHFAEGLARQAVLSITRRWENRTRHEVRPQAKLTKHQAREAMKRVVAGEPLREVALSNNVDHSTICRLKARYAAEV
jgi:hypothetical protein